MAIVASSPLSVLKVFSGENIDSGSGSRKSWHPVNVAAAINAANPHAALAICLIVFIIVVLLVILLLFV